MDAGEASLTAPLSGLRVLEFCHTIMGPTAGLILADLGADVIKIEPADGDRTRAGRLRRRLLRRLQSQQAQPGDRHKIRRRDAP